MSLKMRIKYAKQLKSIKKAMIISAVSRLLEKLDGVKNIHTVILKKRVQKKMSEHQTKAGNQECFAKLATLGNLQNLQTCKIRKLAN